MPIQFPQMYVAYKAIPLDQEDELHYTELNLCFFCAMEFWRDRRGYRIIPFASEHNVDYSKCDRCNSYLDW